MPVLHFMCGKVAAGKSTLAHSLSQDPHAVLLSEDRWLAPLFGDQMTSLGDYARCSGRLRTAMTPHIRDLLDTGLTVVLDFAANTRDQRRWMRELIDLSGVHHQLHYLDLSDETCLARLRIRNASGTHPFTVSPKQFAQISAYFEPPHPDEGFHVVDHAT